MATHQGLEKLLNEARDTFLHLHNFFEQRPNETAPVTRAEAADIHQKIKLFEETHSQILAADVSDEHAQHSFYQKELATKFISLKEAILSFLEQKLTGTLKKTGLVHNDELVNTQQQIKGAGIIYNNEEQQQMQKQILQLQQQLHSLQQTQQPPHQQMNFEGLSEENARMYSIYMEKMAKTLKMWAAIVPTTSASATLEMSNRNKTVEQFEKENIEWSRVLNAQQYEQLSTKFDSILVSFTNFKKNIYKTLDNNSPNPNMKMPHLKLQIFEGKHSEFLAFKESFNSIVVANASLNAQNKLIFLKQHVSKDILNEIANINIEDENCFNLAWKRLEDKYGNKRILISEATNKLFSIPKMQKETYTELKNLKIAFEKFEQQICSTGEQLTAKLILTNLFLNKLDPGVKKDLEVQINEPNKMPEIDKVYEFVEKRLMALSNIKSNDPKVVRSNNVTAAFKCICCLDKKFHPMFKCDKFGKLDTKARWDFVRKNDLCRICLAPHHSKNCKSNHTCKKCGRTHNTLLHNEGQFQKKFDNQKKTSNNNEKDAQKTEQPEKITTNLTNTNHKTILATALVKVFNPKNHKKSLCKILIDQGSEVSLITSRLQNYLELPYQKVHKILNGVGGIEAARITKQSALHLMPWWNQKYNLTTNALVVDKVTDYRSTYDKKFDDLLLADPGEYEQLPIEILIGADCYSKILKEGFIKRNHLIAQNSTLGWMVSGTTKMHSHCCIVSSNISTQEIDQKMRRFFEMEKSDDESGRAEELYIKNTTRLDNGSYQVRLPFKTEEPHLQSQIGGALARLKNIEKKMEADPELREHYNDFMKEYLELGHMEKLPAPLQQGARCVYLPHHVVKKESASTPYRVVFDASAKTSKGNSLNDFLLKGPKIQQDLHQILMRWRTYEYIITADVEKMFRQIKLHKDDQDCQLLFWRFDPSQKIDTYRLKTVTYGMASSGFLAIRTLQQIAMDECVVDSPAFKAILNDFYVDDLLSGSYSKLGAEELANELFQTLKKGNMNLRKWCSNEPSIIKKFENDSANPGKLLSMKEEEVIKTLGMHYCPNQDIFQFKVSQIPTENLETLTKRQILSLTLQLYDPLGLMSPIIIKLKLLIQNLWREKWDWDQLLPQGLTQEWIEYHKDLSKLNQFKFPRFIGYTPDSYVELHGFSDASLSAYGAVVYVKTVINTETKVSLLVAKTRVAPISPTTLARLELNGALLLANLMDVVKTSLGIEADKIILWTDSKIVLDWINKSPFSWSIYVANRVEAIHKLTKAEDWHYVNTKSNPADIITRGVDFDTFAKHFDEWISCYEWLTTTHEYPAYKVEVSKCDETIHVNLSIQQPTETHPYVIIAEKFSNYQKILRILAYMQRFIHASKHATSGMPDMHHYKGLSESRLIAEIQQVHFKKEIDCLNTEVAIPNSSTIKSLNPFIDQKGNLRVGGRIERAEIPYEQAHPLILPYDSHLTRLIVREAHNQTLHGGIALMMGEIRKKYWIVRGKGAVKKVFNDCFKCARFRNNTAKQLMASLPPERVNFTRPFTNTGVDFAGPLTIKSSHLRNSKIYKGYISLFVCMLTRAVHIELVSSMDAQHFEATFKRFAARRGMPHKMFSDNGTNFVRANKDFDTELKIAINTSTDCLARNLQEKGIKWHFNIARAAHSGGIWESAVKSAKYHLKRVVGAQILSFEEMTTVLAQIEAILNSRPLCPLSENIDDVGYVTPGHFLMGTIPVLPGEPDYTNSKVLGRWKLVQQLTQSFWKVWSSEYLSKFQFRNKWRDAERNVEIGQLVLIKDDDLPPLNWKTGRIIETYKAADGLIRSVKIKTLNGEYKRSIHKLALLPYERNPDREDEQKEENKKDKVLVHNILASNDTSYDHTLNSRSKISHCIALVTLIMLALIHNIPTARAESRYVSVHNGKIHVEGYNSCTFIRQNFEYTWERQHGPIPFLWFGSIKYACGTDTSGYLESKMTCIEGGIYNQLNDLIEGCEHTILKYSMGAILGFLISGILLLISWKFNLLHKLAGCLQKETSYQLTVSKDKKDRKKATQNARLAVGMYKKPNQNLLGKKRTNKITSKRQKHGMMANSSLVLLCLFCISHVQCYDKTLYITSKNNFCNDAACEQGFATQIQMAYGSTVKFIQLNGEEFTIKFEGFHQVDTYKMAYYTSDYTVKPESLVECYGESDQCWRGSCQIESQYYRKIFDKALPTNKSTDIFNYGCSIDNHGCEIGYCHHQQRCVFYKWKLVTLGYPAPVYEKKTSSWKAYFVVRHKNMTRHLNFSPDTLTDVIRGKNFDEIFPVVAYGAQFEKTTTYSAMLKTNDAFYSTKASQINMPEDLIIGDLQISLRNSSRTFNTHKIMCYSSNCRVRCLYPHSALRRFRDNLQNHQKFKTVEEKAETVTVSLPVKGSISLMFSSDEIDQQNTSPAKCTFTQINSYACSGCKELSYVTIQAEHVQVPGLITFSSNCTFKTNYVPCQESPFLLFFDYEYKFCRLYFPSINHSLVVAVETVFKGDLLEFKIETSHTDLSQFMKNPDFLQGIFTSISVMTSASFILVFAIRIIHVWLGYRFMRENTRAAERNEIAALRLNTINYHDKNISHDFAKKQESTSKFTEIHEKLKYAQDCTALTSNNK